MSNAIFMLVMQLISAVIFWGLWAMGMGWYIKRVIRQSFDEYSQVKGKSIWEQAI